MDEFMKNIYGNNTDSTTSFTPAQQPRVICPTGSIGVVIPDNNRGSVLVASNEVWRESEMRLENFLRKASNGAGSVSVRRRGNGSDDMRLTPVPPPQQHLPLTSGHRQFEVTSSSMLSGVQYGRQGHFGLEGFGIGGAMGRTKRRIATEEIVMDKATQQKQRRMIKNRESAARSRERKQARTTELESLVAQLQVENAELVKEEAEQKRERLKKITEKVIPVVEKRRPRKVLRRVMSSGW